MNFTRIGLKIRATVQGRETAETLGINTRRIDGFAFSLGAGLAGIAGYALTTIAGVTPDMGQNYIVDSFLVVVTGGVGKLAGSVLAGLGLGTLNQLLEPRTFGEALLAAGLVGALVAWINLTVKAFRQGKAWGWLTLLVPVPLPLAVRFWRHEGIGRLFLMYCLAVAAVVVGMHRRRLVRRHLDAGHPDPLGASLHSDDGRDFHPMAAGGPLPAQGEAGRCLRP